MKQVCKRVFTSSVKHNNNKSTILSPLFVTNKKQFYNKNLLLNDVKNTEIKNLKVPDVEELFKDNPVLEVGAQPINKAELKSMINAIKSKGPLPKPSNKHKPARLPDLTQPLFDEKNLEVITPTIHFQDNDIKVTTLPNGLTVATLNKHTTLTTICVSFKAGPRYEKSNEFGVSSIINRLAFDESRKFTKDMVKGLLEDKIMYESTAEHESHSFLITCTKDKAELGVEFLGDTTLHPKFFQQDIDAGIEVLRANLEAELTCPTNSTILTDSILQSCFGIDEEKGGLGNPSLFIKEDATPELLYEYFYKFYVPSRCYVVAVGIEHERLVDYVNKYMDFDELALKNNNHQVEYVKPEWKPETVLLEFLERPQALYLQNIPAMTSCALSFEGIGFNGGKDLFTLNVLETMLGGGDAFSIGGPGKGLHSIINRYYIPHFKFDNMIAQHYSYSDTGIFTIHASVQHEQRNPMDISVAMLTLLDKLKEHVTDESIEMAKTQYKILLLNNLEENNALVLNAINDIMMIGKYNGVDHLTNGVNQVTKEDILNIIDKIFFAADKQPALAAIGDVKRLLEPTKFYQAYDTIRENMVSTGKGGLLGRLFKKRK
ncbi:hypothetical protein ABK040_007258 [Willaertia magna]